jgi:hypothetical protein
MKYLGNFLNKNATKRRCSVTHKIRSPEVLRSRPSTVFRLFPAEDEASVPPASTAPPRLAEDQGRGKRKRASTAKYQQSVEDGLLKGLRQ